ncbi:MAG: alcohol dehydrogenase catalytic domain-containing protein [Phycisphaerales bacterium]|nr:alcohol dehydrogenase catalytic domain-containing protein [Phycisphaerae bacterium]NNF41487.1 alcohol dehydrogenase catalytic domain-containing protein [Phycisphaerales bacterium]NNM27361.1 alcohol dehydrogenase catalytic domain-containing protein [Phycisphaerales bacterium]
MRAISFDGSEPRLEDVPTPEPGPGEALIRMVRAGVTRTDSDICKGLLGFRGVLGHEFVGVVEAVGGRDEDGWTGKRVVGGAGTYCGRCPLCQAGLSEHCRERTLLGQSGRDGCLAERFLLPVRNLVELPPAIDDDCGVFAEPLASAVQAARQLTIEGKPYITVLGDGALGLLMVQVMAKLNASVRLIGRSPAKLAICEKWQIKHRPVDEIGRRADQDVVVDCSGTADGLALALEMVRPRGTVLIKSLLDASSGGVDLTPLVLNEIRLIGSHRGPIGEAVSLLARGEVDVASLISRRMSLEDGPAVLAASRGDDVVKVLVHP